MKDKLTTRKLRHFFLLWKLWYHKKI